MRLVRVTAAAVVGVAVLAGCSGGETANETLPSASSSAAETTASLPPLGPPDLPMPDEAREQTPAGAEAFLRYYMDVYSAAEAAMDPTYLDQFSQGCALCDGIIQNLRGDAAAGYAYEGGEVTVTSASFGTVNDAKIEGSFTIDQDQLIVRSGDGSAIPTLGAAPETLACGAILTWSPIDESWILSQWDVN